MIIQFATKDGKSLTSHHEVWNICVIYFLDPMAPQPSKEPHPRPTTGAQVRPDSPPES